MWEIKEYLIVLLFLALEGYEDMKTKTIRMEFVYLFGSLGLFLWGYEGHRSIGFLLGGVLIGIVILVASFIPGFDIGRGDGYIFLVTGIYLGGVYNAILCYLSFLLAAGYGLAKNLYEKIKGSVGEKRFPFVPFMLLGHGLLTIIFKIGRFI